MVLFFLLSVMGWIWEVTLYYFGQHRLINCGVFTGPYLPIYGTGGLLLWFLLHKLYRRPVWTFLLSMIISTVFEYIGSVFLEYVFGLRYWDYSRFQIQYEGRICLAGALCFGLFGMLLNCYLLPFYMRLYHKMSRRTRWILSVVCTLVFVLDATH